MFAEGKTSSWITASPADEEQNESATDCTHNDLNNDQQVNQKFN